VGKKWSKYLPLVQRIINTSKHSATGLTPVQIVFPNPSNACQLDRGILAQKGDILLSAYMKELMEAQSQIIAIAEHNLTVKDSKHLEGYSKERTKFEIGSYVLVEHRLQGLRRGPKSKLLPFLRGPMKIIGWDEKNTYHVQNLINQVVTSHNVTNLRPFLYDERTLTPLQTATADTLDEFIVEKVLEMRGDPRSQLRKTLQFKVRWAGYGPEDDTWEPWEFVKNNDQLQEFLHNNPDKRIRRLGIKDWIHPSQRESLISDDEENA
jgi:hypothetical protein